MAKVWMVIVQVEDDGLVRAGAGAVAASWLA